MAKKALIVGIDDYSVQSNHDSQAYSLGWPTLGSCVNDADSMYHLLIDAFKFDPDDIILYKDVQATRRNILSALTYLLANAVPGDVVCFYFSGHGGILPANSSDDNTRFYEAIIPYRGDWIHDFRLDEIARSADYDPNKVNFTIISDSCHSGGMHSTDSVLGLSKSIPFKNTIKDTITHMNTYWPFGMCLPNNSNELIPNVGNPKFDGERLIDLDVDSNKVLVNSARATLLSACQFYEVAYASAPPNQKNSYFTQAILDIVTQCPFIISHRDFIDQIDKRIKALAPPGPQTPQLRGSLRRADNIFLESWNEEL